MDDLLFGKNSRQHRSQSAALCDSTAQQIVRQPTKKIMAPEGVLGKLRHRWFGLGELQGLNNAPLKYDDRLAGMFLGPLFYKLHRNQQKLNTATPDEPRRSYRHGLEVGYCNFSLSPVAKTRKTKQK